MTTLIFMYFVGVFVQGVSVSAKYTCLYSIVFVVVFVFDALYNFATSVSKMYESELLS